MQPFILISIIVFGLIVVGLLIFAALSIRNSSQEADPAQREKHPRGYWVSIGISTGAGCGVALGLVLDQLALGIAIGAAVGAAIGAAYEQRHKDETRPLTPKEAQMQRSARIIGLVLLALGLAVFLTLFVFVLR